MTVPPLKVSGFQIVKMRANLQARASSGDADLLYLGSQQQAGSYEGLQKKH